VKTLVLANHKGGVGKSAVATMLAHLFAQRGLRVLAIDLDHQGNFSSPLERSARAAQAEVTSDALLTTAVSAVPRASFVLVPSGQALIGLERQAAMHSPFARNLRSFLRAVAEAFDICVVDTNPNPDIRVIAALASADHVLSPIQLNQEAMDGVAALLNHERVGLRKIKAVLNPKLNLIGLLPTMVEATPLQRANLIQVVQRYRQLLIPIGPDPGQAASIPRRSAVAEAQADGEVLWEMKKTAARDAWKEMAPSICRIADLATSTAEIRNGAAA
jgi:chromosome partitioning protein